MRRKILLSVCLAAALVCSAQAKQLALVRGKSDSGSNELKLSELALLLRGEVRDASIVVRDPQSPDTQLLLRRVNVTPEQFLALAKAHPQRILISNSDEEIVHLVNGRKGMVGLVDVYSLTKDVDVLKVDGKLPFEPGYILKGN